MKSKSFFVTTYGLGLAVMVALVAVVIGAQLLYVDLGMRPQPLLGVVFDNKLRFLGFIALAIVCSIVMALIDKKPCKLGTLMILNLVVGLFSLTVGCAATGLFFQVDNLGTEQTGPQPGYPFPGFGILLPALVVALFLPFHICSPALLSADAQHDS